MKPVKWEPFRDMADLRESFDRMMERVWVGTPAVWEGIPWNPPMDAYEDGNTITVKVAVPGMKKEDLKITLDQSLLTISGKTAETTETRKEDYYRKEIRSGSFSRTFPIPCPVDREKINATCKDGILQVVLPKAAEARTKEVTVDIRE